MMQIDDNTDLDLLPSYIEIMIDQNPSLVHYYYEILQAQSVSSK